MTKEAKLGLLLGLVFIIAIAVVLRGVHQQTHQIWQESEAIVQDSPPAEINGLSGSMTLTVPLDKLSNNDEKPAAEQQSAAPAGSAGTVEAKNDQPASSAADNPAVSVVTVSSSAQSAANKPIFVMDLPTTVKPASEQAVTPEDGKVQRALDKITTPVDRGQSPMIASAATLQQKAQTYVVKKGDNLSEIACKVYGPAEGNRWVNIKRIYDSNRQVLTSMNDIREGQTIKIPALPSASPAAAVRTEAASVQTPASDKTMVKEKTIKSAYVVQQGDTLWAIAEKFLGDGSRFSEIARLNASRLSDEDNLKPGMSLILP